MPGRSIPLLFSSIYLGNVDPAGKTKNSVDPIGEWTGCFSIDFGNSPGRDLERRGVSFRTAALLSFFRCRLVGRFVSLLVSFLPIGFLFGLCISSCEASYPAASTLSSLIDVLSVSLPLFFSSSASSWTSRKVSTVLLDLMIASESKKNPDT